MWTYDRAARLRALVVRALEMAEHLNREVLDAPRASEARRVARLRLDLVEGRLRRLRLLARVARYNARAWA